MMRPRVAHNDPDQFVGFTRRMMEEERDKREDGPLISLEKCAIELHRRGYMGSGGKPLVRERVRQIEVRAIQKLRTALCADPVIQEMWAKIGTDAATGHGRPEPSQ